VAVGEDGWLDWIGGFAQSSTALSAQWLGRWLLLVMSNGSGSGLGSGWLE
jgi:hypothetical protein